MPSSNVTSFWSLADQYHQFVESKRDPRVDGWLLMGSPVPTLCLCLSYVFAVKVVGPYLMRDRPPFQLRSLLIGYNLTQVMFSSWLFIKIGRAGWFGHYSYRCQPVDYSNDTLAVQMVHASWWYFFSKFTEFFDTMFFILRKKYSHVSHLHVIHHGVMPMSVWFGAKFTPGGHSTFFGFINTFVHIVMYTYYMIAAMGPQYSQYIWWKKYLTTFQMIQFVAMITHAMQLLFIECDYPKVFVWWIGGHAFMFLLLFWAFYKKEYKGKRVSSHEMSKDLFSACSLNQKLYEDGGGSQKLLNGASAGYSQNGYANHFTSTNGIHHRRSHV